MHLVSVLISLKHYIHFGLFVSMYISWNQKFLLIIVSVAVF